MIWQLHEPSSPECSVLECPINHISYLYPLPLQFPVLETPEGSLSESAAISRYIASIGQNDLYPEPLNPTGTSTFWLSHTMSPCSL